MNHAKWLEQARQYLDTNVKVGQTFECKSLFPEHKWNQLTRGERISFGQYFANEVKEGRIPGVIRIDRAKNNHSIYRKDN